MLEVSKITLDNITEAAKNDPFIDGVNFALNYIIDNRSRRFFCWERLNQGKKATKKALEAEQSINKEVRYLHDCLLHLITTPEALKNAVSDYKARKFWGL